MIGGLRALFVGALGNLLGERWSDGTLWTDGTGWIDGGPS